LKHTFFFTEINYGVVEIESDTLPNRDDVIRKVIDGYAIWGDSEYSEIGLLDEKSQTVDYLSFNDGKEVIHGYEIQRTILFTDGKGIALAENLNAPDPYVTWQFTEENGKRDYYWGKYTTSKDRATTDFENRATSYHKDNGVSEIGAYKYYSTQRPIDIATYPKTENGPVRFENYDRREEVEQGRMLAWGHLIYDAPLTDDEIYEYELRAAPDNPDIIALMKEQAQLVGHWEEMKGLPDDKRYTWHRPSISAFDLREPIITPALMARRFRRAEHELALENEKTSPKPIMEQLAEAAKNVQHRDSLAISKNTNRDER
jgi:hypothetical protein